MSSLLNFSFSKRINDALSNKNNSDILVNYIHKYMDKNVKVLSHNTPTYRLYFYDDPDREIIFKTLNITRDEITEVLKQISIVNSSIKSNWKLINDPFNVLMLLIIRYYSKNNGDKYLNSHLMYLTLSLYSSIHFKFFKYEANDNVMQYTINRLSNKYLFKQYGIVSKALFATAKTNHDTYKNSKLNSNDDRLIFDYFISLRSRLNNQIRAFANEYYKDYDAGNYFNNEEDNTDPDNYKEVSNLSGAIVNLSNKAVQEFFSMNINERILTTSCGVAKCDKTTLRKALVSIKNNERSNVHLIILSIIQYYLKDPKNTLDSIGSQKFFVYCLSAYTKSNTKDTAILNIKDILDKFLKNHCDKYNQTDREATKSNYRKALYLYFVLLINNMQTMHFKKK